MVATDCNQADFARNKANRLVVLGHVSGIFGVLGWIKINSATEPQDGILRYSPWFVQGRNINREYRLATGKVHGNGLIVRLQDCDNRDQAATLVGCEIAVRRQQLPALAADDFYWADLEGLQVQAPDGTDLGRVSHLFATGANDVLVVQGERELLIPYLWGQVVQRVELSNGLMVVDWDPTF